MVKLMNESFIQQFDVLNSETDRNQLSIKYIMHKDQSFDLTKYIVFKCCDAISGE